MPVAASLGFSTSKSDCHDFEVRGVFPKASALAALSVRTISPSVVIVYYAPPVPTLAKRSDRDNWMGEGTWVPVRVEF